MPKTSPVAMSDVSKKSGPDKWEIDSWTSTIVSAMEILADPKKMKHVKEAMAKKEKAITSFDELAKKIAEG